VKADDGERGDGLIELSIAIFVLLLVLGAVVHFVAAGFAMSTRTQVVEQATTAAYSALDASDALGCGVATGSENPATLSQLASACHGSLGNASWTQAEGDATYQVTETTSWVAVGSTVPPGDCSAFANLTPTGLATQVVMRWAAGSTAFRRAVSTLVPVPPDALAYHDASLGAIVVPSETTASLDLAGGLEITHSAVDGCVWFPFLAPGAYRVSAAGGTATAVTVQPGETAVLHG